MVILGGFLFGLASVFGWLFGFLLIVSHGWNYSLINSTSCSRWHRIATTQGTHRGVQKQSHFYKSLSSTSLLPPHFLVLSNPGDENKKWTSSNLLKSSNHSQHFSLLSLTFPTHFKLNPRNVLWEVAACFWCTHMHIIPSPSQMNPLKVLSL